MNSELRQQCIEKYPLLFPTKIDFDIDDGWFNIIDLLCHSIQTHINWQNRNELTVEQVTVLQLKEKFGGLRFYYQGGDDYVSGLVVMAEQLSERTCERCGDKGKLRSGGWVKCLCDRHYQGEQ